MKKGMMNSTTSRGFFKPGSVKELETISRNLLAFLRVGLFVPSRGQRRPQHMPPPSRTIPWGAG